MPGESSLPDDFVAGIPAEALSKSMAHFLNLKGPDLLARTDRYFKWESARRASHVMVASRALDDAVGPDVRITNEIGQPASGLNFASQDYLSLASHAAVREAAIRAVKDFGPHSAGSPILLGNTRLSLLLERELGDFLQTEFVALYPTGWGAGFGAVTALVRPNDHIVMDELAHACLQQGANSATPNVVRHKHLDVATVRQALREIRSTDTQNGILVVTEGLFSMDSDTPDLARLQDSCREFGATLLVDVAHDLGALGPGGTGHIGGQGMLGKVDLVMGSFSKTFASNGGFVATHSMAAKQYARLYGGPHFFSNAISPVQAAVVREALRIVRSAEGDQLRASLLRNVNSLRARFETLGIRCYGDPSAIVGVPIGSEKVARVSSALVQDRGVLANMAEFPAVAVGKARFRMQVMANHTPEQTCQAADVVAGAIRDAARMLGAEA